MLSRPQSQPFAQWLLGAAALVVLIGTAIIAPSQLTPWTYAAAVVIGVGSIAIAAVWWARPTRHTEWIALIPLIDILACIPLRQAAQDVLPGAGFLLLFPIGWLAFAFPLPFLVLGLATTVVIPVLDMVEDGFPDAPAGWTATLVLPLLLTLFAVAVAIISRDLQAQRRSALDARTRMSDALRSSTTNEATMHALGDATPDALVVFDPTLTPLLVNRVAWQWARRGNAMTGLTLGADIYGPDRTTKIPIGSTFFRDLAAGEFVEPREVWVGAPGDQIAVRFAGRAVVAEGEIVAFLLVGTDVTELRNAVDVRDRFLDTVGHELRSPLTVIIGNAQLALDEEPERAQARWPVVDRSAERLLQLVDRLITAGREHTGSQAVVVDTTPIVRAALDPVASLAEDRAVDFAVIGDHGSHALISERDLTAIVHELATNAVRFTPAGGSVVVDTRAEGPEVLVEVTDTGVGMTQDERSQAFDRFFRGSHAYSAAVQGAGLGLSIAQRLAASHDATITLVPNAGSGTVATLRLRAASDAGG